MCCWRTASETVFVDVGTSMMGFSNFKGVLLNADMFLVSTTFGWLHPLLRAGYRKGITRERLHILREDDHAENVATPLIFNPMSLLFCKRTEPGCTAFKRRWQYELLHLGSQRTYSSLSQPRDVAVVVAVQTRVGTSPWYRWLTFYWLSLQLYSTTEDAGRSPNFTGGGFP